MRTAQEYSAVLCVAPPLKKCSIFTQTEVGDDGRNTDKRKVVHVKQRVITEGRVHSLPLHDYVT